MKVTRISRRLHTHLSSLWTSLPVQRNSVKTIPDLCFLWFNYYFLSNKCIEEWLRRLFAWFLLFQANLTMKVGLTLYVLMDSHVQTLKAKAVLTIICYTLCRLWCKQCLLLQVWQLFHMEPPSHYSTQIWSSPHAQSECIYSSVILKKFGHSWFTRHRTWRYF